MNEGPSDYLNIDILFNQYGHPNYKNKTTVLSQHNINFKWH